MKESNITVICLLLTAYLFLCYCTPPNRNKDAPIGTDINIIVSEVDVLTYGTDSICTILCYLDVQNLTTSQIAIERSGDDNYISNLFIEIMHLSLRYKEIITYPNYQAYINPNETIKMAVYFENFTYSTIIKGSQPLLSIKEYLKLNGISVIYKYYNTYHKLNVSMTSTPIYIIDDFM